MIQVFTLPSRKSCRDVIETFTTNNIPFVERKLAMAPPSAKELREILKHCTDVYTLIAQTSREYKLLCASLAEEGMEFEDLTIDELAYAIKKHPKMMRTPIVFDGMRLEVGYSEGQMDIFLPRTYRMGQLTSMLEVLRADEDARLIEGEAISTGRSIKGWRVAQ